MGGKNKQRTKGNVRPSSSGRAAELLARESGVVPGFVGFGSSVTTEHGYVPAVHGAEEIDSLVDADFRLVLRKLSKRDTVTKLKAIQEFGSMCQERDAETVKGVLPYWPRIYCKISVDHDRRVREATQQAFEQLVLKVRRDLAPFLKSLMGHWLLAQCDTHTPAASAARQVFAAAFPPSKQPGALSFCRDEVLNVLHDTLLKETADTLSDPQSIPEEERESKFTRMVISSLLGLKKLLRLLPDEDVKVAEDRLTQLVSPAKFWKYSKHRTAQVRGAFFQVISALCCHSPGLVQTEAARACSAVLLGIDDTDPMVLPALWEAVLHVITTVPDCWTHVNARKGFLPKLWALLKEGGGGMAKALHPNLMPLISKLPPHVTGTPLDFCTTFFSSLIQGLSGERAVASPTESAAIVTAMVECLRFSIVQSAAEGDEHRRTQRMLVSQQLLPLLERALGDPSLQNGPLFLLVTEMLISWEKRAGFDGGEDLPAGGGVFRALLGDFWEGLGVLLVGVVDVEDADAKTLEGVATLLRVMRYPEKATRKQGAKKRKAKICFSEPGDGEGRAVGGGERADGTPEQRGSEPETEPERGSLQTRPLEDAVCRLARLCLTYVNEKKSESHLVFLSLLLCSFHEPRVFTMLVESEGGKAGGEGAELKNAAMRFLLERVVAWLTEEGRRDSRPVVEMVFSAVHCCSPQETTRILDHVTTMDLPCGILLQIIQRASVDAEALAICGDWLKGSVLGDRLLGLAEELCNAGRGCSSLSSNENAHSWSLISLVLSQHHNNEPLIGEVYLERILEAFHATLSETRGLSEPLVVFICDAASTFFSSVNDCLLLASSEELLLTVFQITALEPSHTHLSDSLLAKLRGVCLAGVGALVHLSGDQVREDGFLCSAALWVKRQLLTASLDSKSLQVLVAAVQSVAETLNAAGRHDSPLHGHFLSLMTPSQPEWTKIRQALPPQWVKSPLLSGRLRMAPDRPGPDAWTRAPHARLPAHLCTCALLGRLLQTDAPAPPRRQGAPSTCYPSLKHTVTELLYALQWSKEMEGSSSPSALQWSKEMEGSSSPSALQWSKEMEGSSSPSAHHSLLAAWGLLSNDLSSLLPATDLLDALYRRSVEDGGLWSLTLASYIQASSPLAADADPVRRLYGAPDSWFPVSRSKLSTLQAVCPAMARADREAVAACAAAGVVAWRESDDVCGSLAMLLSCLEADTRVQEEVLRAVLAAMMEWRNSREDWLLFSSDLSKASADQLTLAVEMMRFLSWLLTASPTVLGGSQWDFLLCCLLAWLQTAGENVSSLWNPWAQLFVCVSAALVVKLHRFFSAPPPDAADQLPAELTAEWTDFFSEGIYSLLLHLPIKITEAFPEPDDPLFPSAVLRSVGAALTHIPVQQLRQNSLPARGAADRRSELPPALQNLLDALCPLLLFRSRPLQVTVYRLLDKVMSLLPECEGEGESRSEDDSEEPSRSPPEPLMVVLAACEELCDSALAGVQVGECAVVKPLSAEYSCFLGYLLSWKLLLAFFKASPSQLRVQYSLHLRRSQSLHKLLIHVFKMMPENPVYPGQSADAKDTKTFFTESLSLSVDESGGGGGVEWELPHLACSVYYSAVQDLPAMVRLWWNSQEKRVSTAVERFTIRHVSPVLSAQEVSSVHASTQTFDSMTVKARPAAREVVATYSVDDIFIELVIQLPHSYPLGAITVESGRRVGVAVQQWRNWMLQLSTYLTHQNGSIMEGLALWKNNVDKRFEGVEDCMICFSVIHGSNYSLPKKACRTCRKKFHSACLYKWFTSSNKSTCPLCRETFF